MKKRGQVWVETIVYTLIALSILGIVLSYATPKIQKMQDDAILGQSEEILNEIKEMIFCIQAVPGNQRKIDLNLKEGSIEIDSVNEELRFKIKTPLEYSQVGQNISSGELTINTMEDGEDYFVTITSSYENVNITFNNKEELKLINKASTPYSILISNKGGSPAQIDFRII